MFRKSLVLSLVAVSSVLLLTLGCQQVAAPQPTPKAGETPAQKPAAAAVATATKPAEKPVRGGTLRVAETGEPDTQDPHATTGYRMNWQTYEALFKQDPVMKTTTGGLVKDRTISADGKTITLKLQEGVKFHDGTDFDAAAVKFNIERIKDPATKSPYRSDYAKVTSVEVVDGLTVRLNLSVPDPVVFEAMGAKGGQMVSPAAVKKYGQDFGRNPVGTGPFRFVEWRPGDYYTLQRFEGYWKKDPTGNQLPYLEQVISRIVPDETVAFANLRTGQADLFVWMTAEQLPILKSDPNLAYTVRMWSSSTGIYLNTKRPPFNNKALRQAVALAVDRQGMAARLGEKATAWTSALHPMTWAYDEKGAAFPEQDLAKAKAKMAEAGYAGGLKEKMPTGTTAEAMLTAQILKANLAEIGLDLELEILGGAAHTQRVRLDMNYGIAHSSMGQGLADPGYLLSLAFHSQGTRNYYGPYGNPQVDQLLEKAGSIYDQNQRTALYREAAKIIADDAPLIPTYATNQINGMSKKVRNFVQSLENYPRLGEVWLAQ